MTIRYCIRELLLLGRLTAKKARISDEAWTAVKSLGISRPVRGTRAGKSVQQKRSMMTNDLTNLQ